MLVKGATGIIPPHQHVAFNDISTNEPIVSVFIAKRITSNDIGELSMQLSRNIFIAMHKMK